MEYEPVADRLRPLDPRMTRNLPVINSPQPRNVSSEEGKHVPDEELMAAYAQGDLGAGEEISTRYYRRIYRTLYQIVRSREDAEDLTVETFLRVHRNRQQFDPSRKFQTWVTRIATNLALDLIRRRKTESAHRSWSMGDAGTIEDLPDPRGVDPRSVYDARLRKETLGKAFGKLPENYRAILTLRFYQKMSYKELSQALNLSQTNVETLLYRAKQKLRGVIKNMGEESILGGTE